MYVPKINEMTDIHEITDFMKRFSFATVVSVQDGIPLATHLPFIVRTEGAEVKLYAHFARANWQWKDIEANKVLVIFSEPHAYISPVNYDQFLSVPTWNYIAVHVYGKAEIIEEQKAVMQLLESTIDYYESTYRGQWDLLPRDFKEKMIRGIVAFEIKVSDIEAKKKLSQNKTKQERERIIATLLKKADGNERLIADYMNQML